MNFKIKEGYNHRAEASAFDDTPYKDQFQKEVYQAALREFKEKQFNSVLDIGCGSGYKLIYYFGKYDVEGLELEPTLSWLKERYPKNKWVNSPTPEKHYDLIICADVLEHLYDPTFLLEMIANLSFDVLYLSTPERDVVRGPEDMGPPKNPTHFREWNTEEFVSLVSDFLEVTSAEVVSQKNGTLMLRCIKKEAPLEKEAPESKIGRKKKSKN